MDRTAPCPTLPSADNPTIPLANNGLHHFMTVYGPPILVTLVALVVAGLAYGRFLENPRLLWTSAEHDRNAHYLLGLNVALNLRSGDMIGLLHDLDGTRVWGPLHGILLGIILAVVGPDYRVAVLPSLVAWVASALLGFLIARRAVPRGGNLAGAVAAIFILASPAYQAFATDIMLESSGACLTLLVLYLYLVTRQSTSLAAARGLGLALTALFLLKYNYWVLALIPLTVAEVVARGKAGLQALTSMASAIPWRQWLRAQLRHPLNYLFVGMMALCVFVHLWKEETIMIWGRAIRLHTNDNLVHLSYVILFLRALPWWYRHGWQWAGQLSYPIPQVLGWHVLPIALWFLMPKRPSYFYGYLTRNHGGEVAQHDLGAAASYYWQCLVQDYHISIESLVVALGLIGVALIAYRKLRPGGAVVVAFMLFAAILAVRYPSHRSRFLHSWLATSWVVAGIGLAQLVYFRLTAAVEKGRPWLAMLAIIALAPLHLFGILEPGHAPEGGPRENGLCILDVTDSYLPVLADAQRPVVLSNAPIKQFASWTYLENYGRRAPIENDLPKPPSVERFRESFEQWLQKTRNDVIVFIDIPPGSALFEEPIRPGFEKIPGLLAEQSQFRLTRRQELPQFGCTVMIWQRESKIVRSPD